jgi:hypothetical protein
MPPPDPDALSQSRAAPLVAIVDSCVFPRRAWLDPILRGARAGYVRPIWSPLIISEVNRLLTWMWLQRRGTELSTAAWQACSADAKRWFTIMTAVFQVIDDCPPPEETWDSPRDTWDVPIWSAAKRSGAHVIVTANLRDGPPTDRQGRQVFEGVIWCHPVMFAKVIDLWADIVATGGNEGAGDTDPTMPGPDALGRSVRSWASVSPAPTLDLLLGLMGQTSGRPFP